MKLFTATLLITAFLFSCQKEDDLDRLGELDFSRPAAVGGRMMSGYHDGALYPKGQENSLPKLVFDRILEHGGGEFTVPVMTEANGIGINPKPWTSIYQTKSNLNMRSDCEGVQSLGPVKTLYQTTSFTDLEQSASNVNGQYQCAPFATLDRMLDSDFSLSYANGNKFPYYHRMASNPGTSTMIGELIDYNPSFLMGWFGMEEVCSYAQTGGTSNTLTDPVVFEKRLDSVLSIMAANGTKGVLLNIPDVKELPYFQLVQWNGANLDSTQAADLNSLYTASNATHINFKVGDNPFICEDPDAPQGIRHLKSGELLMLTSPLDSMKCSLYGLFGRYFKDMYFLSLDEVSNLDATIQAYNKTLAKLAEKYDFALFDAHTYYQSIETGVMSDGVGVDFEFVTGGFVGLDGIYPNQKGNALLSNALIQSINDYYGTHVSYVNCFSCDGVIFP